MVENPNSRIAHKICEFLKASPTANLSDTTMLIISYQITDWLNQKFNITEKYGVDINERIKYHKQQLAIAYHLREKYGQPKPEPEADLFNLCGHCGQTGCPIKGKNNVLCCSDYREEK